MTAFSPSFSARRISIGDPAWAVHTLSTTANIAIPASNTTKAFFISDPAQIAGRDVGIIEPFGEITVWLALAERRLGSSEKISTHHLPCGCVPTLHRHASSD
jgi:hypothetical protein